MATPTSDQLYAINDAITELAERFGIADRYRATGDDDAYDDMLNDATHTLADQLFASAEDPAPGQ